MATKILLVEDDRDLAQSLADYLAAEGFELERAPTAAAARKIGPAAVDLVILDWKLPDAPGIDLLREWRAQGTLTPVILLTARTDLVDRVVGLELGANDYITKPFEPRELLARLRVQLRQLPSAAPQESTLRCGELELSKTTREVRFRNRQVELSRQEFSLLCLLMENPNRVFSREEILNQAWGYESFPTTRTIDTHILQLRQKTDAALFETVRGIGYRLRTL
ncbi:MAG: response regulator transcription factor [Deltaproteobacteria bacterium]|nr:response regulator transcription factor [Deltaproteobacteria bacterium]